MKRDSLSWDIRDLSKGLRLSEEDAIELFRDGRPAAFLLKRRIASDFGWTIGGKNDPFDWLTKEGHRLECRVLTDGGVGFAPNKMLGVGREFSEAGFLDRLNIISGFIVGDVTRFPSVRLHKVSSDAVASWLTLGRLSSGRMSKETFAFLIAQPSLF